MPSLIGNKPNQVPTNGDLGTLAFQDADNVKAGSVSTTSITDSGNLTFTGTANRITGDFSNATAANRVMVQTSTTNGVTGFALMPNGTASTSYLEIGNSSDPANSSTGYFAVNGANDVRISSGKTGTGSYVPLTIYTGGSERMRIDSSGNVGIGNTGFASRFYVKGGSSTQTVSQKVAFDTQTTTMDVWERSDGAVSCKLVYDGSGLINFGTSTAHPLTFLTSNTERMRIDSSGNVGIGTSSPSQKLQVSGANTVIRLDDSNGGVCFWGSDSTGTYWRSFTTDTFRWLRASGSESMRIDSSGNVGIGTASPTTRLSVQNTRSDTAGTGYLTYTDSGTSGKWTQRVTTTNAYAFDYYNGSAWAETMRITSTGNINIGATSTSALRLFVRGEATSAASHALYIQNSAPADLFTIRNDGYISTGLAAVSPYNNTTGSAANLLVDSAGGLYRSTSSLKYKKEVRDYDKGLDVVMNLRPVYYKGNSDKDGDTQFAGLIAEEVDAAGLTEFVQYAEDGSPDALAYGQMVSLAFKAIQEQQVMIQELKAKVAALEAA